MNKRRSISCAEQKSTKPLVRSSSFIGSAKNDLVATCDGIPAAGWAAKRAVTGFGIRQDTAIHVKDDWVESVKLSSRGLDAECARLPTAPSMNWPRGLCRPLRARPTPVGRGRKNGSHLKPLGISGDDHTLPFASGRLRTPRHVEISWNVDQGRRPERRGRARERRPAVLESEAISETGSSGRRAPIAAYSSSVRAANDSTFGSGHAFFRAHSTEADSSWSE